jgi:4-amino-4-deoxy-L-arabinose transferase-like glycosyltransferase
VAGQIITPGRRRSAVRRRDHAPSPGVGPLIPAVLALLAAVIRLPTLAQQSFWLDEAYTERLIRMSLGGMLHAIPQTESTPPVYYVLAWVWTRVAGTAEYGLRSLSAVAGIVVVPVAYAAARRLAGVRAGAVAGLLVATSPLMVWFSQEARAYALATLLSTVTLLCLVGYLQERGGGRLAGWALAAALGIATHYFVVFTVVPQIAVLWWRSPRDRRRVGAAVGAVCAVMVALVPLALAQRGTGHADYISQGALGTRILQVPKQFLVGYASPGQAVTAGLAALLVLAALGRLVASGERWRAAALPLAVGVFAVLVPIALALVGIDFLNTRNLLPALPVLAIVLGIGCAAEDHRARVSTPVRALAAALALIGVVVVGLVVAEPAYQRADWRDAAQALGAAPVTRAILVTPGSGLIPLAVYQPRLAPLNRPTAVSELDVIALPAQVQGGGQGPAPRPAGHLELPSAFQLAGAVYARTYTVLRYRARSPVAVGPGALAAADRMGPGSATPLLQTGR